MTYEKSNYDVYTELEQLEEILGVDTLYINLIGYLGKSGVIGFINQMIKDYDLEKEIPLNEYSIYGGECDDDCRAFPQDVLDDYVEAAVDANNLLPYEEFVEDMHSIGIFEDMYDFEEAYDLFRYGFEEAMRKANTEDLF